MTLGPNWHRLPAEMKQLPQWAVAGASKAPLTVDATGKLFNTSVNRPSEWLSFEQAVALAQQQAALVTTHLTSDGRTVTQTGLNIGFILNEADPFTIIDLDVKDAVSHPDKPELWTTPDEFDRYWKIVQHFDTYTELSRSGKGLHAIARGAIGPGFRRDGIEVYSQERFIICTGNVVYDRPVQDRQAMLDNMVSQMRPRPKEFNLEEIEPEEDDWSVLTRAVTASNSEKFCMLWEGNLTRLKAEYGFPSQSEADLALMSMLCFYSKSNSQCRRIFRSCALGKREKANKDDKYLNFTLRLIRERQFRETNADVSALFQSSELVNQLQQSRAVTALQAPMPDQPTNIVQQPPAEVVAAGNAPITALVASSESEGTRWPPGLMGAIARMIYNHAPRPVKEVAIVGALGLMAGLAGKAWNIPQTGLNLYVILVARSGIGKEAMHSGISAIIKTCMKDNPGFHKYVDFTEYASGPALIKACAANPCFVNVSGEWGRRLQRLASEDGREGPLQTLRTQMTNLFQKSGPAAIVGGIGYSTTDNNVASISGVSYSLIGETTPNTFFKALTDSMMEDGFMSRFLIVEYEGERPDENMHRIDFPDPALTRAINAIATQADQLIIQDKSCPLGRTEEAATAMAAFDKECDRNVRASNDESRRQMWNRAAIKVMRIAGLCAVGDNCFAPCITLEHVEWAIYMVMKDIRAMRKRLESGDVGVDDISRERKLASVIKTYLSEPIPGSYKIPDTMRQNGIIPRSYLQVRVQRSPAFNSHKLGNNRALDETINSLLQNGYIMDVQKDKVVDAYGFHGKAYRVLKLPEYDE